MRSPANKRALASFLTPFSPMASPRPTGSPELTPATLIRWGLFFLLVAFVTLFYLVVDFKGLSHAKGMDQAQIAREIARGHHFRRHRGLSRHRAYQRRLF